MGTRWSRTRLHTKDGDVDLGELRHPRRGSWKGRHWSRRGGRGPLLEWGISVLSFIPPSWGGRDRVVDRGVNTLNHATTPYLGRRPYSEVSNGFPKVSHFLFLHPILLFHCPTLKQPGSQGPEKINSLKTGQQTMRKIQPIPAFRRP